LGLPGASAGDHQHRRERRLDHGGLLGGGRGLLEQGRELRGGVPGGGSSGGGDMDGAGGHSCSPSGWSGQLARTAQWSQCALRRAVTCSPETSRATSRTSSSNHSGCSARGSAVWVRTAAFFPPVPT